MNRRAGERDGESSRGNGKNGVYFYLYINSKCSLFSFLVFV